MSDRVVKARGAVVPGNCGLGYLSGHDYSVHRPGDYFQIPKVDVAVKAAGGTGFFTTGFINEERCQRMYEHLCKHYKLVFQTPVRTNRNSSRKFFAAVFDKSKAKNVKQAPVIEKNWPFQNYINE